MVKALKNLAKKKEVETPKHDTSTEDDEIPSLEDAPADVELTTPGTPKKETPKSETKSTTPTPPEISTPDSFLKSPIKKETLATEPEKVKPGAKIDEIFAKLDEKKKLEAPEEKKEKPPTSTAPSDVILSKILGKNIRHDTPMAYEPVDEDMALPFDHVAPADNDVTIDQLDSDNEISMSEVPGTASPKTNSDDQFLKTFGDQPSSQLFSEVSEIGVVESTPKQVEIDKDDVNSIETLSASECDDEEMAIGKLKSNRTISGSSGQYSSPRVQTPNRYRGGMAGISEADLKELMEMNEEDLFIDSNDNMTDYIRSPDDLPTPGSGGRGRSRTNKSGPPPVEPLTREQLAGLQQDSTSITDPDIISILTQLDPVSTSHDNGREGPQTLVFTPNQIAHVCNVLMDKGDYVRLTKFMLSLPNDKSLFQNEDVVRAQCVALFHINNFKALYQTLETHTFSSEHHQFLQVFCSNMQKPHTKLGFVVQGTLSGSSKRPWETTRRRRQISHPKKVP